ncbi:hypothetical protein GCM10010377_76290 [Streptomyces viridiviolaceus]|uniref:Uncharacterized protein n=1 Tax=Streptomyces viridiviolaceus TaxID=68282 RepID=A0ABW2DV47_9ACTN|nr:hypothetical protein [Streptomyces viridiviolaceus]GHB74554.1 hypothetical protein GCM10010377_76290 [Streptomyces viridiviolaceus]
MARPETAARAVGEPLLLAGAARAVATPLRRIGLTHQAWTSSSTPNANSWRPPAIPVPGTA